MHAPYRPDALVAPLRADVVSGAAVVGRKAAQVVRRATRRVPAESPEELQSGLGELGRAILDAQPAMAPLLHLVRDVLEAARRASDVEDGRRAAARAAEEFARKQEERSREVARHAAAALAGADRILTLSSSSTVRSALLLAGRDRDLTVVCLEGRPGQEGIRMAERLARGGLRAVVAVDAAAASLAGLCDAAVLGADSVGDAGIVNKIGSLAVADAARHAGIPLHVLADETKILPEGFPQPLDDDRPGEEVARTPAGVRVWNRYFDCVPLAEVTELVTDAGPRSPAEVEAGRRALSVPPELAAWVEERGAGQDASGG